MRHAIGIAIAGLVVGGVVFALVAVDRTPANTTYVPTPPTVEYNEFRDWTDVEAEMPVFRPDGSWAVYTIRAMPDGRSWSGRPPRVWVSISLDDYKANGPVPADPIIVTESGARMVGDTERSATSAFEWSQIEELIESRSAKIQWGVAEYRLTGQSIAQVRALVDSVNSLKAN
ncbi:MAG: hypothetical protein MJH10_12305 [Epibacterium sp.]|nr:hypothetical protein [Epibacterium sp.]NQX74331.1 hypothetical protein [Epibacterium sp.]